MCSCNIISEALRITPGSTLYVFFGFFGDVRKSSLLRAGGNLGSLTRLLEEPSDFATPEIGPEVLPMTGEPRFDFLAILSSTILLVVLLGIAFERILGLDKLLANFLRKLAVKGAVERRQRLERSYEADDEDQA